MSLLSNEPNAASAATDNESILADETGVVIDLMDTTAFPAPKKATARPMIVFRDSSGQERSYGSVLGALTRRFVDIIQVSTRYIFVHEIYSRQYSSILVRCIQTFLTQYLFSRSFHADRNLM
jgi:hypothetical protein